MNDTWYNGSGVVILQVGGEGPIAPADVGDKWSADYFARNMSALNVELEHRYYGDSVPSGYNLSYLSAK